MGFERAPSFGRAGSGVSAATAKLLHHSKRGVDSMPSEWPQNERDFEALAKAGEINYADDDGMTPLHFAARWGGDVATQILVDAKADINAKNKDGKTPLQLVQERCSELGRCPELAKLNRVIAILDPPTLPSARGRGGTATSPLKRTAVKYVMVAYRRNDTELLSSSERQELLLIRANIAPPEPKGGKECKVTQEMKDEIKEMLNEPHLYDENGMLLRASEAKGETIAQHYGDIDLDSLEIKGSEQAMFEEFADIKHGDGSPNCMSIKGLQQALHRMHVDKAGSDMAKEFKVVDLNGDGEIDLEEFLFAVKIRHGHGFEKGQYFITWNAYAVLDEAQKETLAAMFAKSLAHPLYGRVEELKETAETAEQEPSLIMRSLSFKGKNLTTGDEIDRTLSTASFARVWSQETQDDAQDEVLKSADN